MDSNRRQRRVLIVGQSPSRANLDPAVPFTGTKSGLRLQSWLEVLGLRPSEVVLMNASEVVGRRPKISELRIDLPWFCFTHRIALGELASRSLIMSGCSYQAYCRLPHPSGLNRKLNNYQYVLEQLEACKSYLTA